MSTAETFRDSFGSAWLVVFHESEDQPKDDTPWCLRCLRDWGSIRRERRHLRECYGAIGNPRSDEEITAIR